MRARKASDPLLRLDPALKRFDLFREVASPGERVGHFAEGGLHGPVVIRDLLHLQRLRQIEIGLAPAPVEDGERDARAEAPA